MDVTQFVDLVERERRGARFVKAALQVNPYAYVKRHRPGDDRWGSEASFNRDMVDACLAAGIEVVAVTDHDRIGTAESLLEALRDNGVRAFPGAEFCVSDVHILAIFPEGLSMHDGEDCLRRLGIPANPPEGHQVEKTVRDLLVDLHNEGALTIAAHACEKKGLLRRHNGSALANILKDSALGAVAIDRPDTDLDPGDRDKLRGISPVYKRDRSLALISAADVYDPQGWTRDQAWTWIKMSSLSLESLRQAFLDPESRIRQPHERPVEPASRIAGIAWEGGFLDGEVLAFNPSLNVLIGGRGTGKSTVMQSLGYTLDGNASEGDSGGGTTVAEVVGVGSTIWVLLEQAGDQQGLPARWVVRRTVGEAPTVYTADGQITDATPSSLLGGIPQHFGQGAISQTAQNLADNTMGAKALELLKPFRNRQLPDAYVKGRVARAKGKRTRAQLKEIEAEIADAHSEVEELPGLEEALAQMEPQEVEDAVARQDRLRDEGDAIMQTETLVAEWREWTSSLSSDLPVDRAFVARFRKGADQVNLADTLDRTLSELSEGLEGAAQAMDDSISRAEEALDGMRRDWEQRDQAARVEFEERLGTDHTSEARSELLRRRQDVERLRTRKKELERKEQQLVRILEERNAYLNEWRAGQRDLFKEWKRAAKQARQSVGASLQVHVMRDGTIEPLLDLLDARLGGQPRKEYQKALRDGWTSIQDADDAHPQPDMSPLERFVDLLHSGSEALREVFPGLSTRRANQLAELDDDTKREIEELDLPVRLRLDLRVEDGDGGHAYRPLDELSTGQRATAVLLLLLSAPGGPLLIDQPEDDLDNAFVHETVVPALRQSKTERQAILATHNANIPVLGDAELTARLAVGGHTGGRHGTVRERGSIDDHEVRDAIEEVLEGGKDAFEERGRRYGAGG